ncbi:MAG: sugar ABC transporter ATP-binding protein [Verrucomicrobia bacterium]|nr:sugar ABC transporter ATP-binding protein [Verrucomicrobiota bacterium]
MQPAAPEPTPSAFASLARISKSFGGVQALREVSLNLRRGEIHCLVGENGCGKSTLIKILAGVHSPDTGEIGIGNGRHARLRPGDAMRLGIQVIFQDFSLFPNLTVAENIALPSHLENRRRFIRPRHAIRIAAQTLDTLGVGLDLARPVSTLSVARQQLVAIARALPHATRLLVMDEPTAALTHREIERLFQIVRTLKNQGVGILLVSHKIPEIFALADRITVLRNGEVARTGPASEFTPVTLVEAMTGRTPSGRTVPTGPARAHTTPRLRVDRLACRDRLADITFEVQPGEIVGLTGRLGSGRTALAQALFGLLNIDHGRIWVNGKPLEPKHPQAALAASLAYVPEDRLREGLFLAQPVGHNLIAGLLPSLGGRLGWISPRQIRDPSTHWVQRLRIRTPDVASPVDHLSGGNQQKVVLARWLACSVNVLILNRPTAGVDVAAKAEIHQHLREWTARGMSILLISDDLPELLELSHRLLLFHDGRIVAELPADALDADALTARLEAL